MRDDYCDGLGDCLPTCPAGAITFVEREAAAYDEQAVLENKSKNTGLSNWPVQIKLVPVHAPYFENADLLIAADCSAYAYGNFHEDYIRGRITLIGCPKLDEGDYTEKLTAILSQNSIRTITVTRMEVPCCGGIERAVSGAVKACGKEIPVSVHIIGTDGEILSVKRA